MFKRINKGIILGIIFFTLYLILGISLTYEIGAYKVMNFFFGADTFRAFNDLTCADVFHDRIEMHPLFMILTVPFISLLSGIFKNPVLTVVIVQSLLGAINVFMISCILDKIKVTKYLNILLSMIYGFSFTQLIFVSTPETFLFASTFLILLWLYVSRIIEKQEKLGVSECVALVILGVLSFAITLTNYMQFIIALITIILLQQEKLSKKIITFLGINIIVAVLVLSLSWMQHLLYPNTTTFTGLAKSVFIEKNEFKDKKYMDTNINSEKILQVEKAFFGDNFIASKVFVDGNNLQFEKYTTITNIVMYCFGILILVGIIYALYKSKGKTPFLIALVLTLIANFCLHLIYGSDEAFIYTQHFTFLVILIVGVISTYIKNENNKKFFLLLVFAFLILEIVKNITSVKTVIEYSLLRFGVHTLNIYAIILGVIISVAAVIAISYLLYKIINNYKSYDLSKKIYSIIGIITIFILISSIFVKINKEYLNNQKIEVPDRLKVYEEDINEYKREYDNFVKKYKVNVYDVRCDDFFLFGMGNRTKYLYKDGQIINIKTKEVIYNLNVEQELIIPHKYTVAIYTKDKQYLRIFENNDGVFIQKNDKSVLEGTDTYINLYEFSGEQYPNLKKVLYHEILINIVDSKPLPNFLVYDNPWYRDAFYVGMVLKNTNNIELIEDWILSVTDIYDCNNSGIKEADNLGELLYLISLVSTKENDMVNKILEEANKLTKENENGKYIEGITDYSNQPFYQTALLKLGLEKLGIDNDEYNLKGLGGSYSALVWWYDEDSKKDNMFNNEFYPYLGWAKYHKDKKGKIYIGNMNLLTWEKKASNANYDNMKIVDESLNYDMISTTHSWHAAEILLFLMSEDRVLDI